MTGVSTLHFHFLIMCGGVHAHMSEGVHGVLQRVSDLLELESQALVSHYVGAGN